MDDDIEILPGALEMMLPYQDVFGLYTVPPPRRPGADVILDCIVGHLTGVLGVQSKRAHDHAMRRIARRSPWISRCNGGTSKVR